MSHIKQLKSDYPAVFDRYISVDYLPGWDRLVRRVVKTVARYDGKIVQIKQKFGKLVVYFEGMSPENLNRCHKLAYQVEEESVTVCEVCGNYGWLRRAGPRQTLCNEHKRSGDPIETEDVK